MLRSLLSSDNGNTRILLDRLDPNGCAELIDLTSKDIGYYDYQHDNSQDEFLAVAVDESLLELMKGGPQ